MKWYELSGIRERDTECGIAGAVISTIKTFLFRDGVVAQLVSALAFHCQAIGAAGFGGSNPTGEHKLSDCFSPQQPWA